jgi:hypothetical protein
VRLAPSGETRLGVSENVASAFASGEYGAYRRLRAVDERSSEEAARIEEAKNRLAESTALNAWEDEGGATP